MIVTVAALIIIYNTFFLPIKALYTDKHDIIDKQYGIYKVHHIVHLFIDLDCINGIVNMNIYCVLCAASRRVPLMLPDKPFLLRRIRIYIIRPLTYLYPAKITFSLQY